MEITGKIIAVLPAQGGVSQRTGNPWKSQDYVIETHETYPKKCCFRVFGEDKISQFNIQMADNSKIVNSELSKHNKTLFTVYI